MLQETEVFDCLTSNLRQAAEDCSKLAWDPKRGFTFLRLIDCLRKIEGSCRQDYYLRDFDSRWLELALGLGSIRQRAGDWLRAAPSKDGRKVAHPRFQKLGEMLSKALYEADKIKTAATFKLGPISPEVLPAPIRESGRPVQVLTPGRVLLPSGFKDARA